MTSTSNDGRVLAGREAVEARGLVAVAHGCDCEERVIDTITDVLHFAKSEGLDPAAVTRIALDHIEEETEGE